MDGLPGLEIEYRPDSNSENSIHIPVDLFVSNKARRGIANGINLRFTDSSGNLVFRVDRTTPRSQHHHHQSAVAPPPIHKRLLADASGNPLISIAHNQKTSWQGFRKNNGEGEDMMFRADRTTDTLTKIEFEVFLNNGGIDKAPKPDFKMRGSPFYRSCTIYKGDSVVAQTSLMYKLGIQNVLVPRNRFRLTIFPGFADHAFVVALTVIFFYGRKLWI